MACSLEMLPCDQCGREVVSYFIRVVRNEEGEVQYVCEECVNEATEPIVTPEQPNCA
jgi:protein-arginine kinase activator protein McsA